MRILVAEDNTLLADFIAAGLRREGMAVDIAHDGDAALEKASVNSYDVILLDRDLPVIHGDVVCQSLVQDRTAARILMLTAAGAIEDRVSGLDIGADDYLAKPCAFDELAARVRALGRRVSRAVPPVLSKGDLVVDVARKVVTRNGRLISLSRKEFGVLEVLLSHDGRVVSSEELLEHVWDEHADPFDNKVQVTVSRLRRKLGEPTLIETLIGVGYRI
jgi:DNA-binding response OmpR family regulator